MLLDNMSDRNKCLLLQQLYCSDRTGVIYEFMIDYLFFYDCVFYFWLNNDF